MLQITFANNEKTKKLILDIFDKSTDDEGYIVEAQSGNKVLDAEGQPILFHEFGGIKNGSEIFVKDNIVSLVSFYSKYLDSSKK